MEGNAGNDTYIVNNLNDVVIESVGEGNDLVKSSVSFNLAGQEIERLTLTGSGNIDGTGNALNNTIKGNSGNNVINGAGGTDSLYGLGGNDTFVFASAAETGVGSSRDVIRDFEDFGVTIPSTCPALLGHSFSRRRPRSVGS